MKKISLLLAVLLVTMAATAQKDKNTQHVEFRYHGFYSVVDYAFMKTVSTLDSIEAPTFNGISAVFGFQWRPESAVGLGFSYLHDATGAYSQIPIYMEFRTHYTHKRIAPFTAAQAGFSLPIGSGSSGEHYAKINKGGITFALSAGARYAISHRSGVNVFVGYQMLQMNEVERGSNGIPETLGAELFHTLKCGLGFNF